MSLIYQKIKKKELLNILEDLKIWDQNIIPITKHRLISHFYNPYADDEDLIMVIAFDEKTVIGYRVLLPDLILGFSGYKKVAWTSTTFLDTKYRGKGIGKKLTQIALESYDKRLMSNRSSVLATRVYYATKKFRKINSYKEYSFFLFPDFFRRINMSKKLSHFRFLSFPAKYADVLINTIQNIRYKSKIISLDNYPFKWEFINFIDEKLDDFLKEKTKYDLFKYSKEKFNWVYRYPWILSIPIKDEYFKNYHFSSISEKFATYFIKLILKDKVVGFIFLQRRDSILRIPYFFVEKVFYENAITFIFSFALQISVSSIITANKALVDFIKQRIPFYSTTFKKFDYLIPSNIKLPDKYRTNDGDGDLVFT